MEKAALGRVPTLPIGICPYQEHSRSYVFGIFSEPYKGFSKLLHVFPVSIQKPLQRHHKKNDEIFRYSVLRLLKCERKQIVRFCLFRDKKAD